MSLNSIESSSDSFIKEMQADRENNDFSDLYVIAEMVETQHELETLEDIGFQDYLDLPQE